MKSPHNQPGPRDGSSSHLRFEHLVYEVDGLLYATPLTNFDAVAEANFQPQSEPSLPELLALIEDEDGLAPVLSLHQILDPSLETGSDRTSNRRLLMFRRGDLRCGLQVHRCLGVFPIESPVTLPLDQSPLLRRNDSGCVCVIKWQGNLVVVLDPAALVSPQLEAQLRAHLADLAGGAVKKTRKRASSAAGTRGTRPRWGGALSGDALIQVMQVLWLKKMTGELELKANGHGLSLLWDQGEIIHARNGHDAAPEDVLAKAFTLREGRFGFRRCSVVGIDRALHRSTRDLIHEALGTSAPNTRQT